MDPTETYRMWCRALLEEDKDAAIEAHRNLRAWLARGGFEPDWGFLGGDPRLARRQFFTFDTTTGRLS